MTSSFGALNAAASGLNAARYGLSVVSQNMSNASTAGYTRQLATQGTVDASAVAGIFSGHGTLGGTTVTGTSRATDPVLDTRVRTEHARGAMADSTAAQLSSVETLFKEPTDTGLSSQLSTFWSNWSAVATSPQAGSAARTQLLSSASSLVGTLNTMSDSLATVTAGVSQALTNDVASVNTAAGQLAALNGQIAIGAATSGNTNSLLDTRDQLLNKLSKLGGTAVTLQPNGSADVSIGGQSLVSGVTANTMTVDGSYNLAIGGGGVSIGTGTIGAESTALTTTLPGYQSQLDSVADSLSGTVNGIQSTGYDAAGNAGTAMFSGSGAAGIAMALTDPNGIAAAAAPGGSLDNTNATLASQAATVPGSPDLLYTSLVGSVASASAQAQQQATTEDGIVANVDSLKSSVSGVNMDEEATTMLMYQQAFNASSRVLTTIDSMLDQLINHTGVVGLR